MGEVESTIKMGEVDGLSRCPDYKFVDPCYKEIIRMGEYWFVSKSEKCGDENCEGGHNIKTYIARIKVIESPKYVRTIEINSYDKPKLYEYGIVSVEEEFSFDDLFKLKKLIQ